MTVIAKKNYLQCMNFLHFWNHDEWNSMEKLSYLHTYINRKKNIRQILNKLKKKIFFSPNHNHVRQ